MKYLIPFCTTGPLKNASTFFSSLQIPSETAVFPGCAPKKSTSYKIFCGRNEVLPVIRGIFHAIAARDNLVRVEMGKSKSD